MSKLKRETRETQIVCEVRKGTGTADVRVDDLAVAFRARNLVRLPYLDRQIAKREHHRQSADDFANRANRVPVHRAFPQSGTRGRG